MPTLTPDQVAVDLQIPVSTVRMYMKIGNMPAFKVGSRWRIEERDFEAWKEAQKIESGAWDTYRVEPGSPAHVAIVANARARSRNPMQLTALSEKRYRNKIEREGRA